MGWGWGWGWGVRERAALGGEPCRRVACAQLGLVPGVGGGWVGGGRRGGRLVSTRQVLHLGFGLAICLLRVWGGAEGSGGRTERGECLDMPRQEGDRGPSGPDKRGAAHVLMQFIF